jgi:hypothetical protein
MGKLLIPVQSLNEVQKILVELVDLFLAEIKLIKEIL